MFHFRICQSARLCLAVFAGALGTIIHLCKSEAQSIPQTPQMNSVNDQTQTPIAGVGHNYQHLLGETVNFSNGSISFKISFPVAKSRGITLPYAWTYNSATVNPLNFTTSNVPVWDAYWTQPGSVVDGWSAEGMPYATVQVWSYTAPPNQYQTFASCNVQSGMTFTDSSGVTHNLYTSAQATSSTASNVTQVCGTQGYVPMNGDGQVVAKPDPNTAATYLTGTSPVSGGFMVMDKNGTTYSFPGGIPSTMTNAVVSPVIEDRNGNILNSVTDTAGRPGPTITATTQINIPTSATTTETFYEPTAFTVNNIKYTAVWGTTPVNYTIALGSTGSPTTPSTIGCTGTIPTTVSGSRLALQSLTLPNGESYKFQYDPVYGQLSQITYPDGGWVSYKWQLSSVQNELAQWGGAMVESIENNSYTYELVPYGCSSLYQAPVLYSRTVSFDGTTIAQTQYFAFNTSWNVVDGVISTWNQKTATVTTTDNITGTTNATLYTYLPYFVPPQPFATSALAAQIPLESSIAYYDWGQTPKETVPTGTPLKTVSKTWLDQFDMESETTTINATGQTSGTVYTYVTGLGGAGSTPSLVYLQEQDEYDFGTGPLPIPATTNPPSPGTRSSRTPLKKTIYNYAPPQKFPANFASYPAYTSASDQYPLALPPQISSVVVENGSGAIQAETKLGYDASIPSSPPVTFTNHDSNYGTSSTGQPPRANLTSVTRCNPVPATASASCSGPTVTYTYDITGQPLTKAAPCGNTACSDLLPAGTTQQTTTYSFLDNYSSLGGSPPNSQNSNTYLTSITYPTPPSNVSLSKTFTYNWMMGQLATSTDENSQVTTYSYLLPSGTPDPFGRLTSIVGPSAAGSPTTSFTYNDGKYTPGAWGTPNVQTTTLMNSGGTQKVTAAYSDGMGHSIGTELQSDPYGTDYTTTSYDGMGNVFQQSNPYRLTDTYGLTTLRYDALGRKIQQTDADGVSTQQWCYDNTKSTPTQSNCNPQIGTPGGTWVDFADENMNDWQRSSDGLGRLIHVIEPNGTSQVPSLETDYSYNVLDDLLCAVQKGTSTTLLTSCASAPAAWRPRSFSYDGLSQLLSATNPETGTIGYTYDLDGNVQSKTNARGITTAYFYDVDNRLTAKTYTNDPTNTPVSCYAYDMNSVAGSGGYPKGRLANQWSQRQSSSACTGIFNTSGSYLTLQSILNYDALGRATLEQQCTPSNCATSNRYQLNYSFDLASNLTSMTNGSASNPITLTNCFDAAGRLQTVTSSLSGATYPQSLFAAQISGIATCQGLSTADVPSSSTPPYTAFGTLQAFIYGNSGVTLKRGFDKRLRLINEMDVSVAPPTPGSATVLITGSEQSQ